MQAKVASSETAQERSAPRGPGTTQPGRPSHYSAPAPGAREAAYGGSYFRCGAGAICPQSGSRERTKAAAGHATFAHVAPLAPSVTQCATGAHGRAPGPKTRCGDAKRKGRDRSGASDKTARIVGASMRACWGADEYRGRVEGIAPDLLAQFELLEEIFRGRPGVSWSVAVGAGKMDRPTMDIYRKKFESVSLGWPDVKGQVRGCSSIVQRGSSSGKRRAFLLHPDFTFGEEIGYSKRISLRVIRKD